MDSPPNADYHVSFLSWQMLFLSLCGASFVLVYILLLKGGLVLLKRYRGRFERKSGLRIVAHYRYWTLEGSASVWKKIRYELELIFVHVLAYLAPLAIVGVLAMALVPVTEKILQVLDPGP